MVLKVFLALSDLMPQGSLLQGFKSHRLQGGIAAVVVGTRLRCAFMGRVRV